MASNLKNSPLVVYEQKTFKGLSDEANLQNAYLKEPEKMGAVMSYAFGYAGESVLEGLTGGLKNVREITSKDYEWELHSETDRSIEIYENYEGSNTPGYGGQPFEITFRERWFDKTDVLVGDDGYTTVRVSSEPRQYGNGYVYTVQLVTADDKAFCDLDLLTKGARWSKEYSSVEEFSDEGGGHGFVTPYKLRNQLSTLRKTYTVSRNAAKSVMVIEMFAENGQSTKFWSKMEEWTAITKWYKELDRNLMYSTYNKKQDGTVDLKGANGRPVFHGAGLREQIAPSNKRFYTKLTYEILDEFLLDLSYAAEAWGGNHKFVALTGKMGMREFDRAMKEYNNSNGITITDHGTFITGKGSELTIDGHFKTVKFMNNIELTLKEFPLYDDRVRNRKKHPTSGKPVESYRFTFLNFGYKEGVANIRKVVAKDSANAMWHVSGSTSPTGGVTSDINTMKSSGIDGYKVHFLSEQGLQLEDPLSCGELIMKVVKK